MKNWKPKINEYVWIPNMLNDETVKKVRYVNISDREDWFKANTIFRTKALAQSALRDVKKVLKKARKA
jgi:hypothetical protein